MERICRLCLNVLTARFEQITVSMEAILKHVLLDLPMSVTENPIICYQCFETLQQSYQFKMVCRKIENVLYRVYDREKKAKLNLKNALPCYNEHKSEDMCRFCFDNLTGSFVRLDKLNEDVFLKDMIYKCLPEFDLEITERPKMCLACMEKLQILFNFMMMCQDNEEKIKKMMSVNDSKGLVSLSDVLKFVGDMNCEVKPSERKNVMSIIKVETIEAETDNSWDTVPKVEPLDDDFEETKEDTSSHEVPPEEEVESVTTLEIVEDAIETTDTTGKLHCQHCPLTLDEQTDLINHLRDIHQDTCCLHKCDQCDFVTIYPEQLHLHKSHLSHIAYDCVKCDFTTHKKKMWLVHRRTHGRCRLLLKCKVCSIGFGKQVYLDGHILTHHPERESLVVSKVYRCDACQLKTVYKTDWLPHMCQEIVRYPCEHCEYSTAYSVCLEQHKDIMHK